MQSGLTAHLQMNEQLLTDYNNVLKAAKSSYYLYLMKNAFDNLKSLFFPHNHHAFKEKKNMAIKSNISSTPASNPTNLHELWPSFTYLLSLMIITVYYSIKLISKMWMNTCSAVPIISTASPHIASIISMYKI